MADHIVGARTLLCAALLVGTIAVTAHDVGATFPGRNGRIAFASSRLGDRDIFVMGPDGSAPTNLTPNDAADLDPTWTADGERIAFWSDRDGNGEIYAMGADGSDQTNLTNHPAFDSEPSWSPDGTRIAFTSNRDGGDLELYVMNADGSSQTRLTTSPGDDKQPAWSPDGTRIAFVSVRGGGLDVHVMDADGSDVVDVSANPATDWMPSWSPDGTRLAFIAGRDGNFEVYTMQADGSGQTRVTNSSGFEFEPTWSPDGTRLAYSSFTGFNFDVFAADVDGTDAVNLTNDGGLDGHPDWQPVADAAPPVVAIRPGGACGPSGRSGSVDIELADPDTALDELAVRLESSNPRLVHPDDLGLAGSGAQRTVTATAGGGPGTAVVTITVSDDIATAAASFTVRLGSGRPDFLAGTGGSDLLLGRQGGDILLGGPGHDVLCGDAVTTSSSAATAVTCSAAARASTSLSTSGQPRATPPTACAVGPTAGSAGAAVQPDRPGVDRLDDEVAAAPRVAGQHRPDRLLGRRLHDEDDTALVGQRAAQHDEAVVDETVHERGVLGPTRLLLEPPAGVPLRTGPPLDHEVRRPRRRGAAAFHQPAERVQVRPHRRHVGRELLGRHAVPPVHREDDVTPVPVRDDAHRVGDDLARRQGHVVVGDAEVVRRREGDGDATHRRVGDPSAVDQLDVALGQPGRPARQVARVGHERVDLSAGTIDRRGDVGALGDHRRECGPATTTRAASSGMVTTNDDAQAPRVAERAEHGGRGEDGGARRQRGQRGRPPRRQVRDGHQIAQQHGVERRHAETGDGEGQRRGGRGVAGDQQHRRRQRWPPRRRRSAASRAA